jgi:hypothetical protein
MTEGARHIEASRRWSSTHLEVDLPGARDERATAAGDFARRREEFRTDVPFLTAGRAAATLALCLPWLTAQDKASALWWGTTCLEKRGEMSLPTLAPRATVVVLVAAAMIGLLNFSLSCCLVEIATP